MYCTWCGGNFHTWQNCFHRLKKCFRCGSSSHRVAYCFLPSTPLYPKRNKATSQKISFVNPHSTTVISETPVSIPSEKPIDILPQSSISESTRSTDYKHSMSELELPTVSEVKSVCPHLLVQDLEFNKGNQSTFSTCEASSVKLSVVSDKVNPKLESKVESPGKVTENSHLVNNPVETVYCPDTVNSLKTELVTLPEAVQTLKPMDTDLEKKTRHISEIALEEISKPDIELPEKIVVKTAITMNNSKELKNKTEPPVLPEIKGINNNKTEPPVLPEIKGINNNTRINDIRAKYLNSKSTPAPDSTKLELNLKSSAVPVATTSEITPSELDNNKNIFQPVMHRSLRVAGFIGEIKPEPVTITNALKEMFSEDCNFKCQQKDCQKFGIYCCEICYDWYKRISVFCSEKCFEEMEGDHQETHDGRKVQCKNDCKWGRCYKCKAAIVKLEDKFAIRSEQYENLLKSHSYEKFEFVGKKPHPRECINIYPLDLWRK